MDNSGTVENHAKIIDFPHFSVVPEAVDHTYLGSKQSADINVNSSTYRHIMKEWKILDGEKNLPGSIYVQAYETRIDLMRAVMVGSPGTPYHDGLFFFDIWLPFNYPNHPPKVHYISHDYKLNPNLYENGRVCLSLINTGKGDKGKRWMPKFTILQTLVSIQSLVLNGRPYFNEPALAFAKNNTPPEIEGSSIVYNHIAFEQSCKSMIRIMRNPPKNFENFVVWHFRARAGLILAAARDYEKGRMMVGMIDQDSVEGVHNVLSNVGRIRLELVDAFSPYISEAEAMIDMDDNNDDDDDDDDVVVKTKENMKKHKKWVWSKFISLLCDCAYLSSEKWSGENKMCDANFIKIGPVGSLSGATWDEKGHNKIAQIFICHDYTGIYSIQFQYVDNGALVMSNRHGYHSLGSKFDVVKLSYSTEYITWIGGYKFFGSLGSVTFGTNRGQYGPFGAYRGGYGEFNFQVGDQFGGFHGHADSKGVKSIGVYLKPITTESNDVKFAKKTTRNSLAGT